MKTGVEFLLMKLVTKAGLLIFALLTLNSCTSSVSYWQHYQECAVVEKNVKDISDCGKQSRMSYLNKSKANANSRSTEGDEYMLWVELLAKQVEDGEISDTAAKMKLLERNQMLASMLHTRQMQAISAMNSMAPKTLHCRSTGYGNNTGGILGALSSNTMTCD